MHKGYRRHGAGKYEGMERPVAGQKGAKPKPVHSGKETKKKPKKKPTRVLMGKKPYPVLSKKDIEGAKGALEKIKKKRPK